MTIRVLIAEDSPTSRMLLREMLESQTDFEVAGEAPDGARAVEMVAELDPDLVLMDAQMPRMSGIQATAEIMRARPRPIVIVSSSMDVRCHPDAFEAVRNGALMVLDKPRGLTPGNMEDAARAFGDTLRALARVKVIGARASRTESGRVRSLASWRCSPRSVFAIGASAGGPAALQVVLSGLTNGFPHPVLVTQHIAPGFTESYAAWLGRSTGQNVQLARDGQLAEPGVVYLAPERRHLEFRKDHTLRVTDDEPYQRQCPSINRMFASLAREIGKDTVAVQLTGMGEDGAEGCQAIERAGGRVIVQDPASAVISSMPDAALSRCTGARAIPLSDIAPTLCDMAGCRPTGSSSSASASSVTLPRVGAAAAVGSSGGKRRALVVDDSRTFRLILTDEIRRHGFEVSEAVSASDALQSIRTHGVPDLLVVDWNMPTQSGVDFVRELRRTPEYRRIRVLMVSSVNDPGQIELARQAGVDVYLTKPFTDGELAAALHDTEEVQ